MILTELQKYIHDYLIECEYRKRLSKKTIKAYRVDLKQFFEYIKDDDTANIILNFMNYLHNNYENVKTVKRKIASIRAFYNYLVYEGVLEYTPFLNKRTRIKEPKILPRIITNQDMKKIYVCIYEDLKNAKTQFQKKYCLRNIAIIELLFSTGIRISELCNLKKEDIDLSEKTVRIFGKGSRERILYLGNEHVVYILKQYINLYKDELDKSSYFFVNKRNDKLSDQGVRLYLKALGKRLHLSVHITPHMFRHTFATRLLEKEVDIRYIQRILGHSSISITQIYTHVSYPKQKEILTLKNPRNDPELQVESGIKDRN